MLMLRVAADIGERQDDDREAWRPCSSRLEGGECGRRDFRASIERIDPHRSHDVLELLAPEISTPPGSQRPSNRAAMFTPSPRMSSPSIKTSPRLTPMR